MVQGSVLLLSRTLGDSRESLAETGAAGVGGSPESNGGTRSDLLRTRWPLTLRWSVSLLLHKLALEEEAWGRRLPRATPPCPLPS